MNQCSLCSIQYSGPCHRCAPFLEWQREQPPFNSKNKLPAATCNSGISTEWFIQEIGRLNKEIGRLENELRFYRSDKEVMDK